MNKTMTNTLNTMVVAGQPATIAYIPEMGMFRGKFLGLSGYCDFMSDSIGGLKKEGEVSLNGYLEDCKEHNIAPFATTEKVKTFTLRYPESLGERLAGAASERQVSVNTFILETLNERIKHA
ncbi:type II toxin-antitoxin system HicB family antitoxin [Candidatus Fukatsuia symbiotica]|nr:type II toxin-antitoxin system HicB family antitoxin [Candidatus Fukatsuia symbiotica]MEA9445070.1 type II toxin-antitoxin system HicB family antitoxin [Candidatus Fukatsuia symbiotica]